MSETVEDRLGRIEQALGRIEQALFASDDFPTAHQTQQEQIDELYSMVAELKLALRRNELVVETLISKEGTI